MQSIVSQGSFQSTLPRRERHDKGKKHKAMGGFNPRSHEGSDDYQNQYAALTEVSIHAPTKGATKIVVYGPEGIGFQSTLPRRERLDKLEQMDRETLFQSTLPRRERLGGIVEPSLCAFVSIHAPTKGATIPDINRRFRELSFNPRSHEGSDI